MAGDFHITFHLKTFGRQRGGLNGLGSLYVWGKKSCFSTRTPWRGCGTEEAESAACLPACLPLRSRLARWRCGGLARGGHAPSPARPGERQEEEEEEDGGAHPLRRTAGGKEGGREPGGRNFGCLPACLPPSSRRRRKGRGGGARADKPPSSGPSPPPRALLTSARSPLSPPAKKSRT